MARRKPLSTSKNPQPTTSQRIGRIVRAQRKRLQLTQDDLATHSGVGLAFLYQLEHGKPTVRFDKMLRVFEVLGLRITLEVAKPHHPGGSVDSPLLEPIE